MNEYEYADKILAEASAYYEKRESVKKAFSELENEINEKTISKNVESMNTAHHFVNSNTIKGLYPKLYINPVDGSMDLLDDRTSLCIEYDEQKDDFNVRIVFDRELTETASHVLSESMRRFASNSIKK